MKDANKLVGTCSNKYGYVVHFKLLQFFLRKGLKIIKIHECVRFKQDAIYKEYIEMNTDLRSKAANEFETAYFKQKNCSLFGKSMEGVRDRMKVELVSEPARYVQQASKPNFCGSEILSGDLTIVSFTNLNVKLKSTIAIGATVLDLSKLKMYELAYDILPWYERALGCKISLIGGD